VHQPDAPTPASASALRVPPHARCGPDCGHDHAGELVEGPLRSGQSDARAAPFRDELRALREPTQRARHAATALARLAGLPDDATADAADLTGQLFAEIATTWSSAPITPAALRAALGPIAEPAARLEAEQARLRHQQHDLLLHPGHAALVAEITALASAYDLAARRAAELRGRAEGRASLQRALGALPARNDAPWQHAARDSFRSALEALGLNDLDPGEDARWFKTLRDRIEAQSEAEREPLARAVAEVDRLATALEEILG
jgi:hypothetical protein